MRNVSCYVDSVFFLHGAQNQRLGIFDEVPSGLIDSTEWMASVVAAKAGKTHDAQMAIYKELRAEFLGEIGGDGFTIASPNGFRGERWLTASEARDFGVVDGILPSQSKLNVEHDAIDVDVRWRSECQEQVLLANLDAEMNSPFA